MIPIYLDTNTLLDLLASIDGGFSVVEKVSSRSSESKSTTIEGAGEFGISSVLSIFRLDLKGSAAQSKGDEGSEEHHTERYHTYGSLLNRLRSNLVEGGLLKEIEDANSWQNIEVSDFIETRGRFVPNTLSDSLQKLVSLLDLLTKVKFNQNTQTSTAGVPQDFQQLRDTFETIGKMTENGNFQTYVVELTKLSNSKIVMSLFSEYLRDRAGRELPYGEFKVLGKVVRKIDSGPSIDLLKGSVFSAVTDNVLAPLLDALKGAGKFGIKLPDIETKISPPILEIIPIAVYI